MILKKEHPSPQLRRNLVWDPAKERFVDDDEANKLLDHALRDPWNL